ncbi:unnamed protein product (macronuclear) [Paramecium tetraurelia]|uniref:Uncharacterized protein n=1 Tax=Paramecium tetraurelia TaxID=5888 RepID=A0EAB3_PARTE|nr:uncharacterized protein GSPATT00024962001 [Paramecium tetraurelia]CAK92230.1 unnamed protein product [Paramecium tetraurelia]|eukprot:XP_001459627.1 hypothetical protein (macronuclear) [Paramecium tetraurelia strain d4-2]
MRRQERIVTEEKNLTPQREKNNDVINVLQSKRSEDQSLLRTDLIQFQYERKEPRLSIKINENNENEKDKNQPQKHNEISNQNIKCANPTHQEPVLMVVLDPNLGRHERIFCQECISVMESNKKTIGIKKVMEITQENNKKKREYRDIIAQQHLKELEQFKFNINQLKSCLNKNLDEMMENANMWMKDLQNFRKVEYNLDTEIQWLINYESKIEIEQMADEIKPLNMNWVSKLNNKLELFSTFKEYSICINILNNLIQRNKSRHQEKKELFNHQQGQQYNSQQPQRCNLQKQQIQDQGVKKNT